MPIYEYACPACGAEFEVLVRSETPGACPSCASSRLDRKLSLTAAPARGSPAPTCEMPEPPMGGCCGGGCGLN
ncbi:MAG: zinc ribbon domain-containing protein [Gemmatimonadales bacterium]|nr:zinc ribbon domain-containing protein [Gemmatimonadales bacterium]